MRMILLLLALGMWAVPAAWAADAKPKFQVGPISKGRTNPAMIRVNGAFPQPKPTIDFSVTIAEDMPMNELVAIIYFFDANNKLVYQMGAGLDSNRSPMSNKEVDYYNKKLERMKRENPKATGYVIDLDLPTTAQAGRKYYYRHVVSERDPKWTHIVVAVGSKNGDRTGRVYPKADPKVLDFTDKDKVTFWFES